jgi:uncharacterized protein (TIGR03086 family)
VTIDLRPLHRAALALADRYVDTVADDDLPRDSPCAGWDLAALLAHMVGQHRGFASAVRDGDAPRARYAPVPFTPQAWSASVAELLAAFAAADPAGSVIAAELSPAPLPVRRVIGAQLLDTVVHTWDVARALGQDFRPPDDLLEVVAAMAEAIPDTARGPGAAFAAALPGQGDPWHRTLALLGRASA